MSRKIITIAGDIPTVSGQIASVMEDYPFYKANAPVFNQYFNKLKNDLRPLNDLVSFSTPSVIAGTNSNGTVNGMIGAPNGSIYSIPSGATTIMKVTPNLVNPLSPTVTNFGSLPSTANKYSNAHIVGNLLIYMPISAENIMIVDTTNDSISFIGSLGATVNKFGRSSMGDNGVIIAPARVSTQHLIYDSNTGVITLQTAITANTLLQNNRFCSVNGGNGFIYTFHIVSNANARFTKINTTTLVETAITTSLGTDIIFACFNFDGKIFCYNQSVSNPQQMVIINTNDADNRAVVNVPTGNIGGVNFATKTILGADGWLYFCMINSGNFNGFRFNTLNNTVEVTASISTDAQKMQSGAIGIDGRFYGVNLNNNLVVCNFTATTLTQNRILSRYNN
jgi:hypothetical protein